MTACIAIKSATGQVVLTLGSILKKMEAIGTTWLGITVSKLYIGNIYLYLVTIYTYRVKLT